MIKSFFLASSRELYHERLIVGDALMDYMSNNTKGNNIRLQKWEFVDSNFGHVFKQVEYEDCLKLCDVSIIMFWRKKGEYTEREYKIAKELGKEGHLCFVLFKNTPEYPPDQNLIEFREQLDNTQRKYSFSNDKELREVIKEIVDVALPE